eukprot:g8086.t1
MLTRVAPRKNEWLRRVAAERIQRTWRAWYKYCQENSEWLQTTWIAATMIQEWNAIPWRAYHLKRQKLDRASTNMQRIVRAFLVRRTLQKRRCVIIIQRHARGVLARNRLRHKNAAAVKCQALIRGALARRQVAKRRVVMHQLAITLQCAIRSHQANKKVQGRRDVKAAEQAREESAVHIQRVFRGGQGREEATRKLDLYNQQMEQYKAATKLQSMARRDAAIKKAFPHARNGQWVDQIRAAKFEKMNKAATFIRKMWLGARTRRKYLELMEEFGRHVQKVVTIQRYARGFLVRLRMWRQAVRAEEELWAALEIQRVWRGYLGRVKWETKYEEVWQREMAAVLIQRHIRGWLARTKVGRIRRQIARAEFERARRRFRAAQRVQAMLRGALVRKKFARRFWCCRHAAVNIQRVVRGHALRKRVWQQVKEQKATTIQAHIQGWLPASIERRPRTLPKRLSKEEAEQLATTYWNHVATPVTMFGEGGGIEEGGVTVVIPGRAWVVPLLSAEECDATIVAGEAFGVIPALLASGAVGLRTSKRTASYSNVELSALVGSRLCSALLDMVEETAPHTAVRGLHPNWRIARYDMDACGGATRLWPSNSYDDTAVDVELPRGYGLIFDQRLLHSGLAVQRGTKHIAQIQQAFRKHAEHQEVKRIQATDAGSSS